METTYGTYVLVVVVFAVAWSIFSWAFSTFTTTATSAVSTAVNQLNATKGPYTSAASQVMSGANWVFTLFSNPLALAALIALGLLLSAYARR